MKAKCYFKQIVSITLLFLLGANNVFSKEKLSGEAVNTALLTNITVSGVTAGGLNTAIIAAGGNLNTITNLTVSGHIDARDFRSIRDLMPVLAVVDLNATTIDAYAGTEGTYYGLSNGYAANELPDYAFFNLFTSAGKTSLTKFILPSTIGSVSEGAFKNCYGLTEITIPNTVTLIKNYAFLNCSALAIIHVGTSVPAFILDFSSNTNTFDGVNYNTCVLHAPVGYTLSYQNAPIWSNFTTIREVPPPTAVSQAFSTYTTVANLAATGANLKWYNVAYGGEVLAPTRQVYTGVYYVSQTINGIESTRIAVQVNVFGPKSSLDFGGNGRITIPNNNSFNTNAYTIEVWLYVNRNVYPVYQILCEKTNLINNGVKIAINGSVLGFDEPGGKRYEADFPVSSYPTGTFLHLAYVRDINNNLVKAYINGYEVPLTLYLDEGSNNNGLANSSPLIIGASNGYQTGSEIYKGAMDEFRVWNRALTQAEIQNSLNCEIVNPANGLIVNFHFNQGITEGNNTAITTVTDSSGYNNHGTLSGFTMNGNNSNFVSVAGLITGVNCNMPIAVPNNQVLCAPSTVANLVATGINLKWYNVPLGGTPLAATTLLSTGSYYVSQTINEEETTRTMVNITVNFTPAPIASAQTFCTTFSNATVSNLVATGTNLKWYTTATGGTALLLTDALVTGTYFVSQTLNSCESARTPVSVTLFATLPPTATAQNFSSITTVADLTATGSNLKWYDVATGGTSLSASTQVVGGTYYVSQTENGCESTRTAVSIFTPANSLSFDGINDYIAIPHNTSFNVNSFTIETWVKCDRAGAIEFICSKGSATMEIQTNPNNSLRFIPVDGIYLDGPANSITTGVWTHVACVFNPSSSLAKMYINGVEMAVTISGFLPLTTTIAANTAPFGIGLRIGVGYPFKGKTDEFRVWNRVLTQTEIQNHMHCEIPDSEQGLIVNLHFNQGIGESNNTAITSITDASGNNNNGILTNFAMNGAASNLISTGGATSGLNCITNLTAANNQSFCYGDTVARLVATGTAIKWYDAATGGTPLATTTLLTPGNYYVSQTINGTETARTSVSVTYATASPTASPQTVNNMATVADLTATGSNLKWYNVANGGTSLSASTQIIAGTYYVSQTINGCESARVAVSVKFNGAALGFDTLNSYLTISDNASFNVSEFTVETWFKWQATGNLADFICSKSGGSMEIHTNQNNSLRFLPVPGLYFDSAPNTIAQNTWIHVACVYKPSAGLAKMYLNGVEMLLTQSGTKPITTPIASNTNPFIIGSRFPNNFPFLGKMDEFRIWNRALSQTEVQNKMNCEIANSDNGLFVNLHFNQGIGEEDNTAITSITDASGNGNNAVLNNFAMNGGISNLTGTGAVASGFNCNTPLTVVGSQTFCYGATVADLAASGTNLKWYDVATGGTPLAGTILLTTRNYYVSQTINGTESNRTAVSVTLASVPPTASTQTFSNTATVADLTATGTNLKWYNVANGGTSLSASTQIIAGTYYVSQTINGCESARVAVSVKFNGAALSFDTLNSYLTISDNASFNVSEFTVETWFKWQATGNLADFICSKSGGSMEIHTNQNNSLRFLPVPGLYFDSAPNTIAQNTWIHVACVYKPSAGLAKMYLNGVEMMLTQSGTNPITTPVASNSNPFIIGSRFPNNFPFLGKMDEFRIWNRALSQTEIQTRMNCEVANSDNGLFVNLHFNQGIGEEDNTSITAITDASGNGNNAAISNFVMNGAASNLISRGAVTSGVGCETVVNLKVFLEGYYNINTHAMVPVKANQGIGNSTTSVDEITVELRHANAPYGIESTTITMLNTNGTAICRFAPVTAGSYYLAVKTRNTIETWSSSPQLIGNTPLNYDFTTAAGKAYGDNMIQLESGIFGFYSGDIANGGVQDGTIDSADYSKWEADNNNFAFGSFDTDLNGDGLVDSADYSIWEANNNNFIFANHPE